MSDNGVHQQGIMKKDFANYKPSLSKLILSYLAKLFLKDNPMDLKNQPLFPWTICFFTLFRLKSGLTYDLLGLVIGMDGATAKRNQNSDITTLKSVIFDRNFAPARSFNTIIEFENYFRKYDTLIIDAME